MPEKQNEGKRTKVLIFILGLLILGLLGGIVAMFILSNGSVTKTSSLVSEKDIKAATESLVSWTEGEIETIAIDKEIVINAGAGGTQSEENSEEQTTEEYVFPKSDSEYLTDSEVSGKSKEQLRLGRNEILARHGRKFKDQSLQEYFNSKDWYNGNVEPDDFDANIDSYINDVERANIDLIKKYE